ncbi:MerR family transcriptional regulator [Georgenia sp. SUBG003]|uniref:MerR family transcriptional regulator n=1 Tax=Georgenia sp. SUBG003 TaxID=1497974 RepID=UPI0004D78F38|nr:MerR family transcriptional regulator [Georgenia sp. SUBG003]
MEWSMTEITRATGTTSRTLRHYGHIGLLAPSRTGHAGLRYYDEDALVRLQRILLLRGLGLSLAAIADVLDGGQDVTEALHTHLALLEQERDRVDRQIASVRRTIEKREGGEQLVAEEMFDGFDHTRYKDEVEERWGKDAYAAGDRWWRGLGEDEKRAWQHRAAQLGADWTAAAERHVAPDSAEAQALARRQLEWLRGVPGTPGGAGGPTKEYFVGLAEMYVADPRFAASYGGTEGAVLVRDAMKAFADRHL